MPTDDQKPPKPWEPDKQLSASRDQLNLILGFFSRVDTKLSVVLGVDLGMVGLLFSKAPKPSDLSFGAWVAMVAFLVLIGASLVRIYQGSFPDDNGDTKSLVFFQSIAKRAEVDYCRAFLELNMDELSHDIVRQAWRNAVILTVKFRHLRWSYIFMATALLPWLIALNYLVNA